MHLKQRDPSKITVDPDTGVSEQPPVSVPPVYPSQSTLVSANNFNNKPPMIRSSHNVCHKPGQISPISSHQAINSKEDTNCIPSIVTISPVVQEDANTGNITQNNHPRTFPIPRPTRENVLRRLSEALMRRSLTMIDLSQRGLEPSDARLVRLALLQNSSLSVLKLGYNNLGDDGLVTLASGIAVHGTLSSLDLGFNNIGDEGCAALAAALSSTRGTLRTLYLSGNTITDVGAQSLADIVRHSRGLRQFHLTGNCIGPSGARIILESIMDEEYNRKHITNTNDKNISTVRGKVSPTASQSSKEEETFIEELFLGGTVLGHEGSNAVASFLRQSTSLRILSLANCRIDDEQVAILAKGLADNREHLPLSTLQLSFNALTPTGLEILLGALWGSRYLKVLKIDNNKIGDKGANLLSVGLASMSLTNLDVGFNSITVNGMRPFMKSVAENHHIQSLTISGNTIDCASAKAVAYALAYNSSLVSLFLDQCNISNEGRRHITAGIVSNSRTSLQILKGFMLGERAFSLGLPKALETWSNEQVLKFILLMWERMRHEQEQYSDEKNIDPLHLLASDGGSNPTKQISGPLDPATVIAVAQRAFENLSDTDDALLSRLPSRPREPSFESPLLEDAIIMEADGRNVEIFSTDDLAASFNSLAALADPQGIFRIGLAESDCSDRLQTIQLSVAERKKKIEQWLAQHLHHFNELSQLPFNSSELWRLHQHFFVPTVTDAGYIWTCTTESSDVQSSSCNFSAAEGSSVASEPFTTRRSIEKSTSSVARTSAPVMNTTNCSLPLLKRKVSYRHLHESYLSSDERSFSRTTADESIAKMIEDLNVQSMERKLKRPRQNRSRVYFVPRIKAKLDSYLDSCHQKALILLRQLFFVEKSLLNGQIYPIETQETTHLSGYCAQDAEMILLEML